MVKKILVLSIGVSFIASIAFASTTTPAGIRKEIRDQRKDFRVGVKDEYKDMSEVIRDKRASTTEAIRDKRFELNHNASTTPQDRIKFRESIDMMRKETHQFAEDQREAFHVEFTKLRETLKDKLDAERKELRDKLSKIKDERKKQIVETISNRLAEINNNVLDNLTKFVDNLDEVLVKIKTRTDTASVAGKDVAKVNIDIITAEATIKSAHDSIKAQVGKTYPISVTTENVLGDAVSKARDALHDDLEKVRTLVRAAHTSVKAVARALHDVPKVDDDENTATSTPL